jgi:hypothetical protein
MSSLTEAQDLRYCMAILHDRMRLDKRDAWLWQIKARVAEHSLALKTVRVAESRGSEELTDGQRGDLLRSHPLLQDTRRDAQYRAAAEVGWVTPLRQRVWRFAEDCTAIAPEGGRSLVTATRLSGSDPPTH